VAGNGRGEVVLPCERSIGWPIFSYVTIIDCQSSWRSLDKGTLGHPCRFRSQAMPRYLALAIVRESGTQSVEAASAPTHRWASQCFSVVARAARPGLHTFRDGV
jgi:hypothetical protein